jgi:hypothetical protein
MRVAIALFLVVVATGASRQTPNFIVQTAEQQDADEFAQLAEKYRKEIAVTWLGKEMPNWSVPCRLLVYVNSKGESGVTSFQFGVNVYQEMQISGDRTKLKNSVLPHEVTHTVFAHHFRRPVPRWADEGGAVLSEDIPEKSRFERLCVTILNDGRGIKLNSLFRLEEYPKDVMCLYSQGFSVTKYLVDLKDRETYLNFVSTGLTAGWDISCKKYYNFSNVDELEKSWISYLSKAPFKH